MKQTHWPKIPPTLSPEQQHAREGFMMAWHEELPKKYQVIENFNHGFVAKLPLKNHQKTLEIGAGIGAHAQFEDLEKQDYYHLEFREEFCKVLRKKYSEDHVVCTSIQDRQKWDDGTFDRVIAIHVLEHLPDLPKALEEISRLLKSNGYLDIVIPCEGGLAYSLARKISAERMFKKKFGMDYGPIIKSEHLSTYKEIDTELKKNFIADKISYFPLVVPVANFNLCVGMRLTKKPTM